MCREVVLWENIQVAKVGKCFACLSRTEGGKNGKQWHVNNKNKNA